MSPASTMHNCKSYSADRSEARLSIMDRLQLLDLSQWWLGSLILAQEPRSQLKALFGSCSKLQQEVFDQSAIRPVLTWYKRPQFEALAMAEAAGTELHLKLWNIQEPAGLLLTSAAFFYHLQQPLKHPAPRSLSCITEITLSGFNAARPIGSVLDAALVKYCPNLKTLYLEGVHLVAKAETPQLTCASLQKLALCHVDGVAAEWFGQQLLNLPSLTVLDAIQTGHPDDYDEGGVFWAAIPMYSSQLRGLRCEARYMLYAPPWSPATQLPLLEELTLDLALKGDEHMQRLLQSAPNVKRVSLHSISRLTSSFAQVPCSWQELTLQVVYAAGLAKLPLSSCTRLGCRSEFYMSDPSLYFDFEGDESEDDDDHEPTPEQMTAAVQAAQAAGGLQFWDMLDIKLYTDDLELLTAAAPILEHIKEYASVNIFYPGTEDQACWSRCRPLLAVLGQHLRCSRAMIDVSAWEDNPDAPAHVVDLLPHVRGVDFWSI